MFGKERKRELEGANARIYSASVFLTPLSTSSTATTSKYYYCYYYSRDRELKTLAELLLKLGRSSSKCLRVKSKSDLPSLASRSKHAGCLL